MEKPSGRFGIAAIGIAVLAVAALSAIATAALMKPDSTDEKTKTAMDGIESEIGALRTDLAAVKASVPSSADSRLDELEAKLTKVADSVTGAFGLDYKVRMLSSDIDMIRIRHGF